MPPWRSRSRATETSATSRGAHHQARRQRRRELKKDGSFERALVKTKGVNLRGKTSTLPNVEVGDIIEYRYREHQDNEVATYMRLYFQRELPMWRVSSAARPGDRPAAL